MIDGELHIFGVQSSKSAFLIDEKNNLALAKKYWKEEIGGNNSCRQRTKRTTFARVPHYKSGAELAKAVEEAKAKGLLPKS